MTTPTFSHLDDGTSPDAWECARGLAPFELDELLPPGRPLVVVASHPDDESLGAGGLMAAALAGGNDVIVLLCSDGEASHPDSPTHSPERLAEIRRAEFGEALEALRGAGGPALQSQRDGRDQTPRQDNHAASIRAVALGLPDGELRKHARRIRDELRALATNGCAIAAPLREDGHPDHAAAGEAAASVAAEIGARLVEYPIWYWHWASPASSTLWRTMRPLPLDSNTRRAKHRALDSYPSQTEPLSNAAEDAAVLSASFLAHFDHDVEVFRLSTPGDKGANDARQTFNALFGSDPDPWNFDGEYETHKRAVLVASLPRARYRLALELGSATGALTARLAERCDQVVAVDASDTAIGHARERLATLNNVAIELCQLPDEWPPVEDADLVVVSEIGYFLTRAELEATYDRVERSGAPDAQILLCHWLHPIDGWSLTGADVHRAAHERGWHPLVTHRESDFLLEVFAPRSRRDSSSD